MREHVSLPKENRCDINSYWELKDKGLLMDWGTQQGSEVTSALSQAN